MAENKQWVNNNYSNEFKNRQVWERVIIASVLLWLAHIGNVFG